MYAIIKFYDTGSYFTCDSTRIALKNGFPFLDIAGVERRVMVLFKGDAETCMNTMSTLLEIKEAEGQALKAMAGADRDSIIKVTGSPFQINYGSDFVVQAMPASDGRRNAYADSFKSSPKIQIIDLTVEMNEESNFVEQAEPELDELQNAYKDLLTMLSPKTETHGSPVQINDGSDFVIQSILSSDERRTAYADSFKSSPKTQTIDLTAEMNDESSFVEQAEPELVELQNACQDLLTMLSPKTETHGLPVQINDGSDFVIQAMPASDERPNAYADSFKSSPKIQNIDLTVEMNGERNFVEQAEPELDDLQNAGKDLLTMLSPKTETHGSAVQINDGSDFVIQAMPVSDKRRNAYADLVKSSPKIQTIDLTVKMNGERNFVEQAEPELDELQNAFKGLVTMLSPKTETHGLPVQINDGSDFVIQAMPASDERPNAYADSFKSSPKIQTIDLTVEMNGERNFVEQAEPELDDLQNAGKDLVMMLSPKTETHGSAVQINDRSDFVIQAMPASDKRRNAYADLVKSSPKIETIDLTVKMNGERNFVEQAEPELDELQNAFKGLVTMLSPKTETHDSTDKMNSGSNFVVRHEPDLDERQNAYQHSSNSSLRTQSLEIEMSERPRLVNKYSEPEDIKQLLDDLLDDVETTDQYVADYVVEGFSCDSEEGSELMDIEEESVEEIEPKLVNKYSELKDIRQLQDELLDDVETTDQYVAQDGEDPDCVVEAFSSDSEEGSKLKDTEERVEGIEMSERPRLVNKYHSEHVDIRQLLNDLLDDDEDRDYVVEVISKDSEAGSKLKDIEERVEDSHVQMNDTSNVLRAEPESDVQQNANQDPYELTLDNELHGNRESDSDPDLDVAFHTRSSKRKIASKVKRKHPIVYSSNRKSDLDVASHTRSSKRKRASKVKRKHPIVYSSDRESDSDPDFDVASQTRSSKRKRASKVKRKHPVVYSISTSSDSSGSEVSLTSYRSIKRRRKGRANQDDKSDLESSGVEETGNSRKRHYCYFCHKSYTRMDLHQLNKHRDEPQVAQIKALPKTTQERKYRQMVLNRLGDYVHNSTVIKEKKGLIVVAKGKDVEFSEKVIDTFIPCPRCLGFLKKNILCKHAEFCENHLAVNDDENIGESTLEPGKALLFGDDMVQDDEFKMYILAKMMTDDVGKLAKEDPAIILYGLSLFIQSGIPAAELVRQKMRIIARLLIELQKHRHGSLVSFLKPAHFDLIVQCIRNIAEFHKPDPSQSMEPTFKKPSVALKLGYFLKALIVEVRCESLKRGGDDEIIIDLTNFLTLLDTQYRKRVSSQALSEIQKKPNKTTQVLPLTQDLLHLKKVTEEKIRSCTSNPDQCNGDPKTWTELAKSVLARIIVFNARRSGEAARMRLNDYTSRRTYDEAMVSNEFKSLMSDIEVSMGQQLELVELIGKNGKPVPCLLTPTVQKGMELLYNTRSRVGISKMNPYFFALANNDSVGYIRGSDALRTVVDSCAGELLKMQNINSKNIRKYVATVGNLIEAKDRDLGWLNRHFGHSEGVHQLFYNIHTHAIEMTKVGVLLSAIDGGKIGQLVKSGKKLEDITDKDLPVTITEGRTKQIKENEALQPESDGSEDEKKTPFKGFIADDEERVNKAKPSTSNDKQGPMTLEVPFKTNPWNSSDKSKVMRFFRMHIERDIVPKKEEIEQSFLKYPRKLGRNRTWMEIQDCVHNAIKKKRKLIAEGKTVEFLTDLVTDDEKEKPPKPGSTKSRNDSLRRNSDKKIILRHFWKHIFKHTLPKKKLIQEKLNSVTFGGMLRQKWTCQDIRTYVSSAIQKNKRLIRNFDADTDPKNSVINEIRKVKKIGIIETVR